MFDSYSEIIWILKSCLNLNDKRYPIEKNESIYYKRWNISNYRKPGKKSGKNLLIRKSTGYVSYVTRRKSFYISRIEFGHTKQVKSQILYLH